MKYKITRFYRDENHPQHLKVVRTGLTLEEAKAHCKKETTHEIAPNGEVVWFEGYAEEKT